MNLDQIPPVISEFIGASNKPDPSSYLDCFSEDAVVMDEGRERHCKEAIKKWSEDYHFGANVTLEPKEIKEDKDEVIVTFKLNGDYDKTGLPDPLLLDYHFRIKNIKIVNLSIL
jgi:ketosteroid isomerase-like protein